MHVEPHHTAEQRAGLIRAGGRAKVARRLAAVRLALAGRAAQAGADVGLSERQVQTWVAGPTPAGPTCRSPLTELDKPN